MRTWKGVATLVVILGAVVGVLVVTFGLDASDLYDVLKLSKGSWLDADPTPFLAAERQQVVLDSTRARTPKSIAIVGAGASGSAAAFFLARAARKAEELSDAASGSLLKNIVVYEKENYIGGRSTVVYPYNNTQLSAIELGASVFVDANEYLVKTARLFNLTLVDPEFSESGVAIWDGQNFLFETAVAKTRWSSWWDTLAALRRYGPMSPMRQTREVKGLLEKFKNLYNPAWLAERGPVDSVEEFGQTVDLGADLTTTTGEDWAANVVRAGKLWVDEIMEASTRVNYCSDMDGIHALGASVSLASGGAKQVLGGNFQIFKSMLKHSGADVRLGTTMDKITPGDKGYTVKANGKEETFDEVFFAAPWHSSPITHGLEATFERPIPNDVEYRHLHVTLLATRAPTLDAAYFNLPPGRAIPRTILTTGATWRKLHLFQPAFQSISYHGETTPGSDEWVVKIFSKAKVSDAELERMFGSPPGWVLRHEWDSYPILRPVASFPPMEPRRGFHYLAAMEPWVSTMETQTISAREAVARAVMRWWGLGLGVCRGGSDSWDMTCTEKE